MSRENVELTYQAIDAFNRRDLDALLELFDPAVESVPYERAVEGGGAYRGHRGIRQWWDDSLEAIPNLRAELDEVRDLGEVTFVRGRLRGQGAASGAAFERKLWQAMEWRNGKVIWWHAFASEPEALEAVGLRE